MSKIYNILIICFCINIFTNVKAKELTDNPLVHYTGLNIGTTTIFNDYTSMHIGLNYEIKKFENYYGFGFFSEFVFGPHFEALIGFPVVIHKLFDTDLYVLGAPGIGFISSMNYARYNSFETDDYQGKSNRANLLLRFGTGYEFPVFDAQKEIMKISPYLNVDIIAQYKTYMSFGITALYYIY